MRPCPAPKPQNNLGSQIHTAKRRCSHQYASSWIVGNSQVNLKVAVAVRTIQIRLGHESLDVALAYRKSKDAESEEALEHANPSSLALYALSNCSNQILAGKLSGI